VTKFSTICPFRHAYTPVILQQLQKDTAAAQIAYPSN